MGQLVGGIVGCIILGLLVGMLFKQKPPLERAMAASLIAWVVASLLYGFNTSDFSSFLIYAPGAIIAFFYLRWHYGKIWVDDQA